MKKEVYSTKNSAYVCPMHSEIVSHKPGTCSKCKMDLVKEKSEDSHVNHKGHQTVNTVNEETKKGKVLYSCPMDPEIVRHEPGDCPKCGMKLEPKNIHDGHEAHEDHGGHQNMEEDFKRRFFLALPLTAIVLSLSPQIQKWLGFSIDFPGITLILFLLSSVIVIYNGWPFYVMAKGEIKTRAYGMMTLVSLAVISGYLFSVAATFIFQGESLYWEISTLVLAFLFGHWMEMRAVRGATGALAELAKLIPPSANKILGKDIVKVETHELQIKDRILIRPGDKVPIDGKVIEGETSIDESMVTGESKPVSKNVGDEVIGGTVNNDGSLTVEVTKTGEKTAISQMMELVREAQETKPPVQKLADQAAKYLTFVALTVGISTFLFWFFIGGQGAIFAGTLAIAVIVIACPHALGLAIPVVTTITTSLAAKNGILIRDMGAAEIARKITYIVFDKTGTLTTGKFGVSNIVTVDKITDKELLQIAAGVEFHSQHSIAQGVVEEAKKRNISFTPAKQFNSFPGKGASANVGGKEVIVGNKTLMKQFKIPLNKIEEKILKDQKLSTNVWIAENNKLIGVIGLEDVIRSESKDVISTLKGMGIKTAMLTGDNEHVADSVAKRLGIDTVFAEVLPKQKVEKVKELQNKGEIVAMVGDGVNDAASLTQAHVGIAIGAGTDVAVESAEIVLIKDNPKDVVKAIKLSKKTNSKMKQNLFWAAGYNLIAIPVAAGALFPFGIILRPEWSALIMSASSVIVVSNALLLKRETLN